MSAVASAGRPLPALRLPRLSPVIPRTVVPGRLAAANAAVARFLIDAKAFDEGDVPSTWDDSLRACEQALASRIRREIGPLRCLRPGFGMHLLDADGYTIGTYAMNPRQAEAREYRQVELYWGELDEHEWPVGPGLEALDAALPGLGATVLQVLRERGSQVYPLFTPDIACDAASYVYWCGEDNEEIALDMHCGEDEQEREAMRAEMVTRAMLDESFPDWARRWMGRGHPRSGRRCSLRRAASMLTDPRLRQIVADAQALARLKIDEAFRPEIDGEYIGFGAVLSWHGGDMTTRVYDDLLQIAHQGECCERMGEHRIPLDDPGALGAWVRAMRPRFRAIGLIDRLIYALSE